MHTQDLVSLNLLSTDLLRSQIKRVNLVRKKGETEKHICVIIYQVPMPQKCSQFEGYEG